MIHVLSQELHDRLTEQDTKSGAMQGGPRVAP
jgi:hypothetical protein